MRLLKPLIPGPVSPMRKRKLEKLKAILTEFDPIYNPKQKLEASKRELPLNTIEDLKSTPKLIQVEEAGILKNYSAIVPISHCLEVDALAVLNAMTPGMEEVMV